MDLAAVFLGLETILCSIIQDGWKIEETMEYLEYCHQTLWDDCTTVFVESRMGTLAKGCQDKIPAGP